MTNEQQKEYAQHLQEEYTERQRDTLDELHELDAKVKRPAEIFAYSFGVVGSLVLGTGMCLAMGVIGAAPYSLPFGIAVGLLGIAIVSVNYLLYKSILKTRKGKYGARILELSERLINEKSK